MRGFFAGSTITKREPKPKLPECGACKLHKKCTSPKMQPKGKNNIRVLFVGEAPTPKDDKLDELFTDEPGLYLRKTLRKLDVKIQDCLSTNAIICKPQNYFPTSKQVQHCAPNFQQTIKEFQPNVIVPMGRAAIEQVLSNSWFEDIRETERWVGWKIPCQTTRTWICPTYSPKFVLESEDDVIQSFFEKHLSSALELVAGKPPSYGNLLDDIQIITDVREAAATLDKWASTNNGAIAWDYETNMLKPESDEARIVSCSVAYGNKNKPLVCIAYPWHGEAIKATRRLLRSPMPKIAANMKFEDRWTRQMLKTPVRNWVWDTQLSAHVLDNRPGITSIEFQAYVRFGIPPWSQHIKPFLKTKKDETVNKILSEIDIRDLLLYNGMDSLIEYKVALDQIKEMGHEIPW